MTDQSAGEYPEVTALLMRHRLDLEAEENTSPSVARITAIQWSYEHV